MTTAVFLIAWYYLADFLHFLLGIAFGRCVLLWLKCAARRGSRHE